MRGQSVEKLDIEVLNLSTRAYHGLVRNKIRTINQLLELDEEALRGFRALGEKSLEEIKNAILSISGGKTEIKGTQRLGLDDSFTVFDMLVDKDKTVSKILFKDNKNNLYKDDIEIKDLGLKYRTQRVLCERGYTTVSDILGLQVCRLYNMKDIGKRCKSDIRRIMDDITYICYEEDVARKPEVSQFIDVFVFQYGVSLFNVDVYSLKTNLYVILNEVLKECSFDVDLNNRLLLEKLYKEDYLYSLVKNHVLRYIQKHKNGVLKNDINVVLPIHLRCSGVFDYILDRLVEDKVIEVYGDRYKLFYPNIFEYVFSLDDEREQGIMLRRLRGETILCIADEVDVCPETVRLISQCILAKMPRLKEDKYKGIFEKYSWDKKNFVKIFGESDAVYYYLRFRYKMGSLDLTTIVDDVAVDKNIRDRARHLYIGGRLFLGDKKLRLTKNNILEYLIRCKGSCLMTYSDVKVLYEDFLNEHCIDKRDSLKISYVYIDNLIKASDFVLSRGRHVFRFFDVNKFEVDTVYNYLHLDRYKDVEYSTLKIFEDNKAVMKLWDIRDEYELHNFLKKVFGGCDKYDIAMSRMPNIVFGNASRDKQVEELLLKSMPISRNDFASVYSRVYGVKEETVKANYLKCVNRYFVDGLFRDCVTE